MRKIIAGINMTLDGFCDHTAVDPDEKIHEHYADLIASVDAILYGRITYQLMEYWQNVIKNPTGNQAMDEFAVTMDRTPKIVFSHSLDATQITKNWETAKLATQSLEEEVLALKAQSGKPVLVGSRSLIIQLLQLNLIDEFQLCIHPVVVGKGLPLFENLQDKAFFKLLKTKTFSSGAIVLYYKPISKD